MIGIGWIDPHRVIVDMRTSRNRRRRCAAILGNENRNAEEVYTVGVFRVDTYLTHVPREFEVRAGFSPARAVIVGAIHLRSFCLKRRVDGARLRSAYIEPDAPDVTLRQSLGELCPCRATVY